jgi:hypothetical protein
MGTELCPNITSILFLDRVWVKPLQQKKGGENLPHQELSRCMGLFAGQWSISKKPEKALFGHHLRVRGPSVLTCGVALNDHVVWLFCI